MPCWVGIQVKNVLIGFGFDIDNLSPDSNFFVTAAVALVSDLTLCS